MAPITRTPTEKKLLLNTTSTTPVAITSSAFSPTTMATTSSVTLPVATPTLALETPAPFVLTPASPTVTTTQTPTLPISRSPSEALPSMTPGFASVPVAPPSITQLGITELQNAILHLQTLDRQLLERCQGNKFTISSISAHVRDYLPKFSVEPTEDPSYFINKLENYFNADVCPRDAKIKSGTLSVM